MGVLLFDPDLEPFKTRLNRVIVVFFFNSSKIRLKEKLAHPRTQIVENSHLSVYSKSTYLLNTHTLFLKLKEVYFFKKKKRGILFHIVTFLKSGLALELMPAGVTARSTKTHRVKVINWKENFKDNNEGIF